MPDPHVRVNRVREYVVGEAVRPPSGWRLWGRGFFIVKTPWVQVRVTIWRRFDDR